MSKTIPKRVRVTLVGWLKHNPRKDVKQPSWFRLSNRIIEDPDLFNLTDSEFRAFIYVMGLCSQKNTETVDIVVAHAEHNRIKHSVLSSCLEKLSEIGIVAIEALGHVTCTSRARNVDVTDAYADVTDPESNIETTNATDRQTDRDNKTDITDIHVEVDQLTPEGLLELWNQNVGDEFSKARELTAERRKAAATRLKTHPSRTYWVDVITRVSGSDFCKGTAKNSTGWVADFDWLLKPKTHTSVMEDKYKNRFAGSSRPTGKLQRVTNADDEINQLHGEVFGDAC